MTTLIKMSRLLTTLGLLFLFGLIIFAYDAQINVEQKNTLYTDFGKFYQSHLLAQQNKNPYSQIYVQINDKQQTTTPGIKRYAGNLNTPFFQFITAPFGHLSYPHALMTWTLLSILMGMLSLYFILQITAFPRSLNVFLFFLCGLLIYFPTFINIICGQITLIILPLVVAAWHFMRKEKIYLFAIAAAILACIKLFFALFLIYFFAQRQWQALMVFLVSIFIASIVPTLIYSLSIYPHYYTVMHHIWWYSSSWNASIYGFLARIFGANEKNIPLFLIPSLAKHVYHLLFLVMTAGLYFSLKKDNSLSKRDLDFSLMILFMILLSPLGWIYYFPLLIIPIIVLYQETKHHSAHLIIQILVCIALLLSASPHTLQPPSEINTSIAIFTWASYYFYGLILLTATFIYGRYIALTRMNALQNNVIPNYLIIMIYVVVLLPSGLGLLKSAANLSTPNNFTLPTINIIRYGNE